MAPDDLPCLIVDRGQEAASGTDAGFFFPAEAHGSARINVGEIEDRVAVAFGRVEQAGVGREGGRLPIDGAVGSRRNQRAGERSHPLRDRAAGRLTCSGPWPSWSTGHTCVVTRRSPVTRSSVKKYPLRAAVKTSFLILPLNIRRPAPASARNRSRACREARWRNTTPFCRYRRSRQPGRR